MEVLHVSVLPLHRDESRIEGSASDFIDRMTLTETGVNAKSEEVLDLIGRLRRQKLNQRLEQGKDDLCATG